MEPQSANAPEVFGVSSDDDKLMLERGGNDQRVRKAQSKLSCDAPRSLRHSSVDRELSEGPKQFDRQVRRRVAVGP